MGDLAGLLLRTGLIDLLLVGSALILIGIRRYSYRGRPHRTKLTFS